MNSLTKPLNRLSKFALMAGMSLLLVIGVVANAKAATYQVNSLADPGDGVCDATCTLRDAILAANANPGPDELDFSGIPGWGVAPVTIVVDSQLPVITETLKIDASIPEARDLPGDPTKRPGLELDYSVATPKMGAPPGFFLFYPDGLTLASPAASGSEVRGLVINGLNQINTGVIFSHSCLNAIHNPDPIDPTVPEIGHCAIGIYTFGADNLIIAGNYINLDVDGLVPDAAGLNVTGIMVVDGNNNTIGGKSANDRNVIAQAGPPFTANAFLLENSITVLSRGWATEAYGRPRQANNNTVMGNYVGINANREPLYNDPRGIQIWNINVPGFFYGAPVHGWGDQCRDDLNGHEPCEMKGTVVQNNVVILANRLTTGASTITHLGPGEDVLFDNNIAYGGNGTEIAAFADPLFNPPRGLTNVRVTNNSYNVDPEGTIPDQVGGSFSAFGVVSQDGDRVLVKNNVIRNTMFESLSVADSGDLPDLRQKVAFVENSIESVGLFCAVFAPPGSDCPAIQLIDSLDPLTLIITFNDFLDLDEGSNDLQNMPALTEISFNPGTTFIKGFLHSEPNKQYRIDLYSSDTAGLLATSDGHGELQSHLAHRVVSTDDNGNAEFSVPYNDIHGQFRADADNVTYINATATSMICEPDGDPGYPCVLGATSEPSKACAFDLDDMDNAKKGATICPPDIHAPVFP